MKTILCYGDSNLRGTIPGPPLDKAGLVKPRYSKEQRWTGILQKKLGDGYNIIEEGIGGRTTTLDDTIRGRAYRNGLKDLPFCLESHYPIDLVIFLLGTNDTQAAYNRSVEEIGKGMTQLIRMVLASDKGPKMTAPQVLVISPQSIRNIPQLDSQFAGEAVQKSKEIAAIYQQICKDEKVEFLDAGSYVQSSEIDGIHLDPLSCHLLGEAVYKRVNKILNLKTLSQ